MEHIGHQQQMDKNVYACMPGLRAMKTVTPLLEEINRVSLVRISLLTVLFSNIYIFRFDDNYSYQSFVLG